MGTVMKRIDKGWLLAFVLFLLTCAIWAVMIYMSKNIVIK